MRYLVEIDGVFYGYDTPAILRCDIITSRQQGCTIGRILEKQSGLYLRYKDITEEQLREAA